MLGVIRSSSTVNKSQPSTILYFAGSRWDGITGTDRQLVTALAERISIIWIDPPQPFYRREIKEEGESVAGRSWLRQVAPQVTRLTVLAPPGASRFGLRSLASWITSLQVRRAVRILPVTTVAVVIANPQAAFPRKISGKRVLYVTDDWVAGSDLMGLSKRRVQRSLARNCQNADFVASVSTNLAATLDPLTGNRSVRVLANGCAPPIVGVEAKPAQRRNIAVVLGQLNERLDMDSLEAVRRNGIPVLVIGPRTERCPETSRRLDQFLKADNVTWLGEQPMSALFDHLSTSGVGLTPYADTPFNRASFPLKTLEYLAAGLPVVSTDLPSVKWLDTGHIEVSEDAGDFARLVRNVLLRPPDPIAESHRRAFAAMHSWTARADEFLQMIQN